MVTRKINCTFIRNVVTNYAYHPILFIYNESTYVIF